MEGGQAGGCLGGGDGGGAFGQLKYLASFVPSMMITADPFVAFCAALMTVSKEKRNQAPVRLVYG